MVDKAFSRREMMKLASLGLVGGWIGLRTDRSEAMMHPGGDPIIDPPPGDLFEDPSEIVNLSSTPGIVEVELNVEVTQINIKSLFRICSF